MKFKPITIEITDVNKPPVIRVEGIRVPVVEFEHVYETRTAYHEGTHRHLLKYIEDNRVKAIGYGRATADERNDIECDQCKKCGSTDIDSHDFIADGRPCYSSAKCLSCGHEESESFD